MTMTEEELAASIVWTGGDNLPKPFDPQLLYQPHPNSDPGMFKDIRSVPDEDELSQEHRDALADLVTHSFGTDGGTGEMFLTVPPHLPALPSSFANFKDVLISLHIKVVAHQSFLPPSFFPPGIGEKSFEMVSFYIYPPTDNDEPGVQEEQHHLKCTTCPSVNHVSIYIQDPKQFHSEAYQKFTKDMVLFILKTFPNVESLKLETNARFTYNFNNDEEVVPFHPDPYQVFPPLPPSPVLTYLLQCMKDDKIMEREDGVPPLRKLYRLGFAWMNLDAKHVEDLICDVILPDITVRKDKRWYPELCILDFNADEQSVLQDVPTWVPSFSMSTFIPLANRLKKLLNNKPGCILKEFNVGSDDIDVANLPRSEKNAIVDMIHYLGLEEKFHYRMDSMQDIHHLEWGPFRICDILPTIYKQNQDRWRCEEKIKKVLASIKESENLLGEGDKNPSMFSSLVVKAAGEGMLGSSEIYPLDQLNKTITFTVLREYIVSLCNSQN